MSSSSSSSIPAAANYDEALRALDIARRNRSFGDFDNALRMVRKSLSLCPTPEARELEVQLTRGGGGGGGPAYSNNDNANTSTRSAPAPTVDISSTTNLLNTIQQHLREVGIDTPYHVPIFILYSLVVCAFLWRFTGAGPLPWPF
eukprot:PhF_6_TR34478/c0_g1_i1/m.50328